MNKIKIIFLLSLFAICGGCTTHTRFAGWLNTDGRVVAESSKCPKSDSLAILCRDDHTNSLNLWISPQKKEGAISSWRSDEFSVLAAFSTDALTDSSNIWFYIPLMNSTNFSNVDMYKNKNKVYLSFNSTKLGVDLIGAALTSPSGIRGIFRSPDEGRPVEIIARLLNDKDVIAKASYETVAGLTFLKISNYIEIPINIQRLQYNSDGENHDIAISSHIDEQQSRFFYLCYRCEPSVELVKAEVLIRPSIPSLNSTYTVD